jgi:DNA-binding CsgD family transcriptional regulator
MEPNSTASNAIASAILDEFRLPVFVVDGEGAVKYSNAAALAELKASESFKQSDGVLTSAHPADSARLKSAIAAASEKAERQTIPINDARNARPHLVTLLPFRPEGAEAPNWALIFVQKCEPKDPAFANALRQLFRLSTAETDIAAALVLGADVEQIAEMRNAKITTVRTQIAAMLLKTRTRRQGELIALFSRISTLP